MPRIRNMEPRRRTFLLDAQKGKKRPETFGPDGSPRSGGFDYPEAVFGPYKTRDKEPSDILNLSEQDCKASGISTALRRGTLKRMPEQKPAKPSAAKGTE